MHISAIRCRAALVAAFLVPTVALAGAAPKGEAAFTAWMAKRLQAGVANARVEVDSPLTLKLRQPDGEELLQANLDRVYDFCTRAAAQCEDTANDYVATIAEHLQRRDKEEVIEPSMVRVVVRTRDYVESVRKQMPADKAKPLVRPLAGDLMQVAVLDFPRSIRLFTATDAKALKLKENEVFELGLKNLRAELKPLTEHPKPTAPQSFAFLDDSPYEASRLALHAEWKPIADKVGGNLIVAVPAADVVLYGRGDSKTAADVLHQTAKRAAQEADRPLSVSVFRWTESGWKVVR
jgi:uncharacterized protein YtpQ (UPF0354 family)